MANLRSVLDLYADRHATYFDTFSWIGSDFTSGVFKMQARLKKDTTGTPLINLTSVTTFVEGIALLYAGTDTIANHIAAGRMTEVPTGYTSSSSVLLSQIRVVISDTTLQSMPFPAERGDDLELAYDLVIT